MEENCNPSRIYIDLTGDDSYSGETSTYDRNSPDPDRLGLIDLVKTEPISSDENQSSDEEVEYLNPRMQDTCIIGSSSTSTTRGERQFSIPALAETLSNDLTGIDRGSNNYGDSDDGDSSDGEVGNGGKDPNRLACDNSSENELGGFIDDEDEPQNSLRFHVEEDAGLVKHTSQSLCAWEEKTKGYHDDFHTERECARLINTPSSLDWGTETTPFTKEGPLKDVMKVETFFDFTSIDGNPFQEIAGPRSGDFDTVDLTFCRRWSTNYSSYRAYTLPFNLKHRTFMIAERDRMLWFLVLKPRSPDSINIDDTTATTVRQGMKESAMTRSHAVQLTGFIVNVMMTTKKLSRRGVTKKWVLGSDKKCQLDQHQWPLLQHEMFERWQDLLDACPESFWIEHSPTIHCYRIGGDLQFKRADCQDGSLAKTLTGMYNIDSVENLTLAIATNICYHKARYGREPPREGDHGNDTDEERRPILKVPMASLVNTEAITHEYEGVAGAKLRIFPMAYSPEACSFQAQKPPRNYSELLLDTINRTLNHDMGTRGLVYVEGSTFQGYSLLKQYVRNGPQDFQLGGGDYVAGFCAPTNLNKINEKKRQKCLEITESHEPFEQLESAIRNSVDVGRMGVRFEPVVSINIGLFKENFRTWGYVCKMIIHPMANWGYISRPLINSWTKMYNPTVFPEIYHPLAFMLKGVLSSLKREWVSQGKVLDMVTAEGISTVERLARHLFTGNNAHLPQRVWTWLGLADSLESHGWPLIRREIMDLRRGGVRLSPTQWPRIPNTNPPRLNLTLIASIKQHYGIHVASVLEQEFHRKAQMAPRTVRDGVTMLREVLDTVLVSDFRSLVLESLEAQHSYISTSTAAALGNGDDDDLETINRMRDCRLQREALIKDFSRSQFPFSNRIMKEVIDLFYRRDPSYPWREERSSFPRSDIECLNTSKFADIVMEFVKSEIVTNSGRWSQGSATGSHNLGVKKTAFCKPGMTWLAAVTGLLSHDKEAILTPENWKEALVECLSHLRIEIIPGPYNGRLSGKRFTQLTTHTVTEGREPTPQASFDEVAYMRRVREVVRAPKKVHQLPVSVPFITPPQAYLDGKNLVINGYLDKPGFTNKIPRDGIGRYLTRCATILNLTKPRHKLILLIGYALSSCQPPPSANQWILGDDRNNEEFAKSLSMNICRKSWFFMFVSRALINSEVSLQAQVGSEPKLGSLWAVFESRKVNARLMELVGLTVRVKGWSRPQPRFGDVVPASDKWVEDKLREATEASKLSALRFFGVFLPETLAKEAVEMMEIS